MSYILDALRKSEQERQIAAGRGVGMLYPATLERQPKNAMRTGLLAGFALAAVLALLWWSWPRPSLAPGAADKSSAPISAKTILAAPPAPRPAAVELAAQRKAVREPLPAARATVTKALAEAPPKKNNTATITAVQPPPPAVPAAGRGDASDEAPKGLPRMNISGYINDEQGTKLAIINDKLLREGDEVAPGLRLEKIIGENAVFSYKGQRFRQ